MFKCIYVFAVVVGFFYSLCCICGLLTINMQSSTFKKTLSWVKCCQEKALCPENNYSLHVAYSYITASLAIRRKKKEKNIRNQRHVTYANGELAALASSLAVENEMRDIFIYFEYCISVQETEALSGLNS